MRRTIFCLLVVICLPLLGIAAIVTLQTGNVDDANELANKITASVVRISTDGSTGTGFVVMMGGKRYVVTNRHVIRSTEKWEIETSDGSHISSTSLQLAADCDLVRLEIGEKTQIPALSISDRTAKIGERVVVVGNSLGAQALTSVAGQVMGASPTRLEVDAEFVGGNSGSPVVNMTGQVFGVATYVTREPSSWVTQDTRFDEVRRWALVLHPDIKWVPYPMDHYRRKVAVLDDANRYMDDYFRFAGLIINNNISLGLWEEHYAYVKSETFSDRYNDSHVSGAIVSIVEAQYSFAKLLSDPRRRRSYSARESKEDVSKAIISSMDMMTRRFRYESFPTDASNDRMRLILDTIKDLKNLWTAISDRCTRK